MIDKAIKVLSFIGVLVVVISSIYLLISIHKSEKSRVIRNKQMEECNRSLIDLHKSIQSGINSGKLKVVSISKDGINFIPPTKKNKNARNKKR